jgi:hypothetical protein
LNGAEGLQNSRALQGVSNARQASSQHRWRYTPFAYSSSPAKKTAAAQQQAAQCCTCKATASATQCAAAIANRQKIHSVHDVTS